MSGFLGEPEKTLSLYDARADFYGNPKVQYDARADFYGKQKVKYDAGFIFYGSYRNITIWNCLRVTFCTKKPEEFFLYKRMRLDLKRREMQ